MTKLSPTLIGLVMGALLLCTCNEFTGASESNLAVTDSGSWVSKANMPTARSRFSVSVVDGKIYTIGGIVKGGYSSEGQSAVEEYDPETNVWKKKAGMPTARMWLTTAVVNGKIYAIGGLDSYLGKVLRTVEVYDPILDSWTRKADMHTARRSLSSAVVNGKIYVIGGTDTTCCPPSKLFCLVEEYDPVTGVWTKKADMPTSRIGASLCTVDKKIYAIGGCGLSSGLQVVEVYDPKVDIWTAKSEMLTKRLGHSASVVDGKIYVIGGTPWGPEKPHKTMEEYNLHTDTWTTTGYMVTPRMSLGAGVVDGKIYVIGGQIYYDRMPLAISEEYDPKIKP